MSKASFGWVCRSPPKTVSDKLWTACWVAADRARYSSPFVRSILFGGVYHLDALWAARLVTALLRYSLRFQGCPPWSLRFGSPCATLNTWLLRCHWVRVRPWVWQHPLGGSNWIFPFLFPLNSSMVGLTIVGTCFVLVGALISSKNGVLPPVMNFSKSRLL